MTTHISLRPYQAKAHAALSDALEAGLNPLVVMPTGTGKSINIAEACRTFARPDNQNNILLLTHSAELVKQDMAKICALCQDVSCGVYCAGIGLKDTTQRIIAGTVQSVYKLLSRKPKALGKRQLLIIDEAHMLSDKDDSMYRQVIAALQLLCPSMQVLGFSATPYRMDTGPLVRDDSLFNSTCIDLTSAIPEMIEQGYLSDLVMPPVPVKIELTSNCVAAGKLDDKTNTYTPAKLIESRVTKLVGNEKLLSQACDAMVESGKDRKAWIVFVTGIQNAGIVAQLLNDRGIDALEVNSGQTKIHNDRAIADFRAGRVRCLVSANQLTTGFDVPQVDLIGVLRPTLSTSLHVQMLGRGLRPAPGKANCMVLDFAENLRRLGPVNDPYVPTPDPDTALNPDNKPDKIVAEREFVDKDAGWDCPECGMINRKASRVCCRCGYSLPQSFDLDDFADNVAIAKPVDLQPEWPEGMCKILNMTAGMHQARSGSNCIRLTLVCESPGKRPFNSFFYLSFDRPGYPCISAGKMWQQFKGVLPAPKSTLEAMQRINELKRPRAASIKRGNFNTSQKYDELTGVLF